MSYAPFIEKFGELGWKETRSITILNANLQSKPRKRHRPRS